MNPLDNQIPNTPQAPVQQPQIQTPSLDGQAVTVQNNTQQPIQAIQPDTNISPSSVPPSITNQVQSPNFTQPVTGQPPSIPPDQQSTSQPSNQLFDNNSQNQSLPNTTNFDQPTTPIVMQAPQQIANPSYPQADPINISPTQESPSQNVLQNIAGLATSPAVQNQPNIPNTNSKSPLVTLAAQLTFGGSLDPSTPKTPAMKAIGIVIIVVSLLLSAGTIFATVHVQQARAELREIYGTARTRSKVDVEKAIKASGPDMQPLTADGKLDVSKLFNQTLGAHKQDIKGEFNKQINMSNGVSFAVTGAEKGWVPASDEDYYKPSSGHEYIKFTVMVGYRGKTESASFSSSSSLKLKNSAGGLQDAKYLPDKILSNDLETYSRLNPGDFKSGYAVFEIKKSESPVSLVYAGQYYDSDFQQQTIRASIEVK